MAEENLNMMSKSFITSVCVAGAIFCTLSAGPASAQTMDSRTEFTFNTPVELPGTTLPPGTYIFRFVDTTGSRSVLQVLAKDSTSKTYGMFMTINAIRPRASDNAELRFLETPAGMPAAVKTWWYPGNTTGREFIYPKSQARRLAQATNQTVLTTEAETTSNDQMQTAGLVNVSPTGQETPVSDEQLVEAAATTPPVAGTAGAVGTAGMERAQVVDRTPVQETQRASAQPTRTRLPKTNSALPLLGLLGMTSMLGGAAIRFRR
jgi:hypothetical protein